MNDLLWQAKLAAWTHDPAEKALVLLRDPAGHEGGTVRALRQTLFPEGVAESVRKAVQRADHWAAAADRPQFGGGGREAWAQVNFAEAPVLIHPLSGEVLDLKTLTEIDPAHIRALSEAHFEELIVPGDAKRRPRSLSGASARSSTRALCPSSGSCCPPTRGSPITRSGRIWTLPAPSPAPSWQIAAVMPPCSR